MDLPSGSQLLRMIQRTLNCVDARLENHGERVAILVYYILKCEAKLSRAERSTLYMMSLLHDIGAYKTEEIDEMLKFEQVGAFEHSVYGYLFLKNLSPLGAAAKPILYHHLPHRDFALLPLSERDYQPYAELIHLADFMDVMVMSHPVEDCRHAVKAGAGSRFDPDLAALFLQTDTQFNVLETLKSGQYSDAFDELCADLILSDEDTRWYLSMLAYSIDFHSEFMVLHTVTTLNVSMAIGRVLQLSEEDMDCLYFGALLHDIGKMACPVSILEKPGKLTAEEMETMKQHVVITREILQGVIDPSVVEIAARHHEKKDGSGYPQGLTEHDLTIPQRIAAVADIVSALIRRRSYKDAFDKQTTLTILMKLREEGKLCEKSLDVVLERFDDIVLEAEQLGASLTAAYQTIKEQYLPLLALLHNLKQ